LRHVSGQAGLQDRQGVIWLGPFEFVAVQFLLLLGFWFVAWAAAMVVHRPWRESDLGLRYLWWMSAPMFVVFLLFSLTTHEEPNWPITAYLSGLVLATGWLAERLHSPLGHQRMTTLAGLLGSCALGLFVILLMHHSEWLGPTLVRLSGPVTPQHPLPRRRFDPTCRLRGWQTLGAEVDRLREHLRARAIDPLLAATSWTVPGELGFYCREHPQVYSFGLALGDRHSQYDLWDPNPLTEPEHFRGRTFIVIGDVSPLLRDAFDEIETSHRVTHRESGQPVSQWTVTVCRGFRGFPKQAAWANKAAF
jgi:hypothetical protein